MHDPLRGIALALTCVALAASCEPAPPEFVWVREPGSPVRLEIAWDVPAAESLVTGRWIDLHANRETGRWTLVARRDLAPGAPWLRQPPPAREENVEGNVTWRTAPAAIAEFNLPTAQDLHSRRVRFNAAGTCTLWATSHDWSGGTITSDSIACTILP